MILSEIDEDAFSALAEPYRRELQVHCYRMIGTVQDAEDMVQETFFRAWRRRDTAQGLPTFRAWLYKIATHVCLDALKKRPYRVVPINYQPASAPGEPLPAAIREPIWLEPYPDDWLVASDDTPEAHFSEHETIALAFVAALHLLPPRQRAVLILRDVLEWEASEVADLLEMTVAAVKSALHRARATLALHHQGGIEIAPIDVDDTDMQRQLDRFVLAWETADMDGLLRLLKEDATFSMPPILSWYRGWEAIRAAIVQNLFKDASGEHFLVLPTRANRQPAFGLYHRQEAEDDYHALGIGVLTFNGTLIADMTIFGNPSLFSAFALPMTLPVSLGGVAPYRVKTRSSLKMNDG